MNLLHRPHNLTIERLQAIWRDNLPETACEKFDALDISVNEVQFAAGETAADYYHIWILKRIL